MQNFLAALEAQRWDDHRYYHHSTINQALHLFSAICFLCGYCLIFTNPVAAALIGWIGAMVSRQLGHFFFEPRGYDDVNGASHEYKEEIKVGYNLRRKVVLMGVWAMTPLIFYVDPTLFGIFHRPAGADELLHNVAIVWIAIGCGALLVRAAQLTAKDDVQTAVVWLTKIITDPFHDIMLYYHAPLHLLRGQLLDPATRSQRRNE